MSNMLDVFVICLESTKQKRCLPTMHAWQQVARQFNLAVQAVKATTPSDFDAGQKIHVYARSYFSDQLGSRKTTDVVGSAVEAACALSHISIWKRILASQKAAIVLEDDAWDTPARLSGLLAQLGSMPSQCEVYLLKFIPTTLKCEPTDQTVQTVQTGQTGQTGQTVPACKVVKFAGATAYWLSPSGAKKLLQSAEPVVFQLDIYMSACIQALDLQVYTKASNAILMHTFLTDALKTSLGSKHSRSKIMTYGSVLAALVVVCIALIVYCALRVNYLKKMCSNSTYKTNPINPINPVNPVNPINPTKPTNLPNRPKRPNQPNQSNRPVRPIRPVRPNQPNQPIRPIRPNRPVRPVRPKN
jgi:GR25 family glycosyltransferase involved in LPS biosynthesis